ncbi:MAG: M12 family metallo-peptidase, partial [Vicingaceae bacterium]|nr:M12 family metallo-peptidase [Vicingaceae bacterium]
MKKSTFSTFRKISITTACFLMANLSFSQNSVNAWSQIKESDIKENKNNRFVQPNKYKVMSLNLTTLNNSLQYAKLKSDGDKSAPIIISLPTPDGGFTNYKVYQNTTMHPGLMTKFPEIRTYNAVSTTNNKEVVKLDVTPHGFHAMILSPEKGTIFIDPYSKGDVSNYQVYYRKDYKSFNRHECGFDEEIIDTKGALVNKSFGDCQLRTYRLALACTGEYATAVGGGTTSGALAAQVTTMNRVNGLYERDIAVTTTIIPNNNLLIFTNAGSDPYTNNSGGAMLGENQATINGTIGSANYDIGHVFSTGGGGIAGFGVVCSNSQKARGVTGSPNPQGDPFDIDYVAHEMGHQFRASHSYNNSCSGNRENSTAYEPGSGSSIMAYAGICTPNVQGNSDDAFHGISLEQIGAYITGSGNSCAVKTPLTNNVPNITSTNIDGNITIPANTPFALTATASDADGDALTYSWEQFDKEISTQPPLATATSGPNFRSYEPSTNPTRYFPELFKLSLGVPNQWEVLPSVSRVLNFRAVVRDNASGGGCNDHTDVSVIVDGNSGPFIVTNPTTTGITWERYTNETITWNAAGTESAPVSCANVDILLSKDGGQTYPIIIATNTPNDGSETITVPNHATTQARIMIICSNGTFFDISDRNFSIVNFPVGINSSISNNSIASFYSNNNVEL